MLPPPEPPSAAPACDCRLSGSCESRSSVPDELSPHRRRGTTVPAIGARTVEGSHRAAGRLDGRPGLHPLGGRQGGHRVGERPDAGRELGGGLVGLGARGVVLRLRDPQRGERLGPGPGVGDALGRRPGPVERPLRGGVGRARCRRGSGPTRRSRPTPPARPPAAPGAARAGPRATRHAAAPGRAGPARRRGHAGRRRRRRPRSSTDAVARAATTAGASTTSVTVARPTAATRTSDDVVAGAAGEQEAPARAPVAAQRAAPPRAGDLIRSS